MEMDSLRGELERLFELDELMKLSSRLLGFDPGTIGGTTGKASFVRALTSYCDAHGAVEALCDAVVATKPDADARLQLCRSAGLSEPRELELGESFEEFQIEERLGAGPQGTCYRATRDGTTFRLKVLHPETARDPRGLQRFLTFTRILASYQEPAFPAQLEAVVTPERTYLAQSWYEGESLAERLNRAGPLPASEAQNVLLWVARGLCGLHERGTCHGNLKLQNILIQSDTDGLRGVQLLDAGCDLLGARRAANGLIEVLSVPSPSTVAPERLRGHARAPSEDVYALGAIGYELVTGKPAFTGRTALDAAFGHLKAAPEAPSKVATPGWVSPTFDAFLLRLLDKDPEARPADALGLVSELEQLMRASGEGLSEAKVQERIEALLEQPESEELASALDAAAGPYRPQVYDAFLAAAEKLSERPEQVSARASLLRRAASGLASAHRFPEAEAAYAQLVGLGQATSHERNALEDVKRSLGKHEEIIESLLARIEAAETPLERATLMAKIGEVYARDLGDQTQAVVALSQALCEDPRNRSYVRRIEEIAGAESDLWSEISSTCSEAAADEERAPSERAPLLEQLGVWYTKQGRPELALPCFQTALKLEPKSVRALDGVAGVYRTNKMWSELGDLLVHRADVSASPSDARELRTQAAQVLEKHLQDLDGARELYERIIREDPGDIVVSQALSRIYEQNQELDRLVPLLTRQAEQERGPRRHAALCRLGDLQRAHLGDLDEARRCYEAVLEESPNHPQALQGLDQTLAQAGRYKDLLASLHRQLENSPTPRQQVALWERIAALYEEEFLLHADAAVALESVLRLDPSRTQAMASLERLYRTLEQWQDLSELYQRHSDQVSDPREQAGLLVQKARVLAEHLGDLPEAIHVYEQVTQLAPERIEAFEAIADLHEALGNVPEAIQAVQNVAERVSDPQAKVRLYMRTARLLEAQGASDESLTWYQRVVALEPAHAKAVQALRAAYTERGDTAGLIDLLQRDLREADGERAKSKLATEIAVLELTRNKNPAAAERAARQALELDPSNLRALILIADIALRGRRYSEAMEHYQRALSRLDTLPVPEAIRVRSAYLDAAEHSPTRSPTQMLEQAEILLRLAPDDASLLERAADLAFHYGTPEQTRTFYSELLEGFRDALSNDQLALATYRLGEALRLAGELIPALVHLQEATELAPDSPHPLVALAQIQEALRDYQKLALTKRKMIDLLEPEQRADAYAELAELELEKLADPKAARASFEAALQHRPDDRRVLIRLMQIHSQAEDWAELVEVVTKLASFVDDPAQRAKYLMTAAMVSSRQLGRRDQAVQYYRQVLELDPGNAKALGEYVVLQVEQGDSAAAERALVTRLDMARAKSDSATQLEMLDALFTLYQGLPGKLEAAVETAEAAAQLEPQNPLHKTRLKELYERDAAKYLPKAVALHIATLRVRPDDEDAYRRLRKLYTDARRADAAWCLCQVLDLLKLAQPEESRFFQRAHTDQPAPAQTTLDDSDWTNYLIHPSVDPRVTQIFALMEPVVVAVRGQSLASLGYDPHMAVDLSQHPYTLGGMLFFAAGVMAMPLPPTFENHHEPGGLLYLNSNPPSIVMGLSALQQLPLQTAAFIAARQLANYRPGFLLRHILASIPVLKAWLFAAFRICSPHFPVGPELEGPVLEAKAALERYLAPLSRDRLVEMVSRLLQSGSAIDLKEWVTGVDFTADRVGLLLANDLKSVTDIIKTVEDPHAPPRERRLQELILFAIDESFFALRSRLGVALESSN
jgi:tetratricopeptide (TPR) repeat protein